MQRVFVYGTLKSGQPNHHLIQEGLSSGECRYEGVGVTELKYPLVVASHWKVPFLLDAPDTPCAKNVIGEVYLVTDAILKKLDELEAHPDFYTRCQVPIVTNAKPETMWCYLLQDYKPHLLELSTHTKYDSELHGTLHLSGVKRPLDEETRKKFIEEIKR